MSIEGRFRAVNDYARGLGYETAFPNFEEDLKEDGRGLVYGAACLKPDAVKLDDVPISELGYPKTIEEKFRKVNKYAQDRGYETAFPNFQEANKGDGRGVVYGVAFLKRDAVKLDDVPISELGYPKTVEEKFVAVNRYARNNGYEAAFPNFEEDLKKDGRGVVYGVAFLKRGTAAMKDVRKSVIDSPNEITPVFELLRGINKERVKYGMQELKIDDDLNLGEILMELANVKTEDMSNDDYPYVDRGGPPAHISPRLGSPMDQARAVGCYHYPLELAGRGNTSAAEQIQGWLNSPAHRPWIVDPDYRDGTVRKLTHFGAGYYFKDKSKYKHYWVLILTNKNEEYRGEKDPYDPTL